MKSTIARSITVISFSIMFTTMAVFATNAAEPGLPTSGAGPAEVKKDTTPIPESGIISITFLGNTKFTSEQLLKAIEGSGVEMGAKPGPGIIGPAMAKLVDFYRSNGADLSASPNIIDDPKGITFIQFIIDENGTKGDIGGLVSSGGPHIFCE